MADHCKGDGDVLTGEGREVQKVLCAHQPVVRGVIGSLNPDNNVDVGVGHPK